ncbi:hypothetical protein EG68_03215 [Paragonimus skrjabini miyazakii]|uniref:Tetraspanin n=1 Tax=Paragonimus skrjabini miyazakii TaxID=59628 RepID=A0A8S9Z3Z5_9TREM|nr:hypothetical protein EG68_03215 [Paragonimus skrjabini miyazakii]
MGYNYGCMINSMRAFLLIYNTLLLFIGIGLVAGGAIMITQYNGYVKVVGPDLSVIPILLCVIGGVIIILSVLGIVGAAISHSCMLVCYSGILVLLMLGEVALCVASFVGQERVQRKATVHIVRAMSNYVNERSTRFGIDMIQQKFNCCGIVDYRDWGHVFALPVVPRSCCIDETHCHRSYNITNMHTFPPGIRNTGCLKALSLWAENNIGAVIAVLVAACVLQLLGILFGFILAQRLKSVFPT